MFEPIVEVGRWLLSLVPRDLCRKRPRFNYLMVHYLYLLGMSIAGSIILYGSSFIPYNDAIFFAVGAATQSGLNTINVNDLLLYQQVTCMLIACVTNPIFINTAVVFVRLYWFEKRFKHIVQDLREKRRMRAPTISRTKSDMKEEKDVEAAHGVNGREITVLHETTPPNGMSGATPNSDEEEKFKEKMGLNTQEGSVSSTPESSNNGSNELPDTDVRDETKRKTGGGDADSQAVTDSSSDHHLGLNPSLHRDIRFADEVPKSDDDDETPDLGRIPEQQKMSKHIEFLQRQQRYAKEGTALRIPGPRAFERGEVPEELRDSIDVDLHRPHTMNTLETVQSETDRSGANTGDYQQNADDHTQRSGIKFDEQEHPGHRQNTQHMESTQTMASRFSLDRIRSGLNRRRRNSNAHVQMPHIGEAKGSVGRTFNTLTTVLSRDRDMGDPMPYLSWQATTGRNSAFLDLTVEQREELGGIEYRSLKTLAKILMCYFVGFHLSGLFVNLPYILLKDHYKQIVLSYGQDPSWWAVFTSASLFNDLGLTLTPNSMYSFAQSTVVLLYGSFLIIIGNTGFPVMLRFVIWVASKVASHGSPLWEELRFLLDHPRRCFTLLFPSKATWWLFWILVLLNGVDLIFFIVLDLNDKVVTSLPPGYRVLDGWFQAASTRTAGFACVNLADLHPAIQVSYLIMMYISVFPIAISVRRTNVYEEKSLGIFGGEEEAGDDEENSYVGQHLRRQLSFDLWYVFLGLFVISIVEGSRISNTNDFAFTIFSVLFEIVSAYGTVGLSLGYPGTNASFSAQFKILSKLVICAMMIRGRHRGLPYALDRAILLPSEGLQKKEAEDADRRARRRGSIFAEGPEAERARHGQNWSQVEVDEYGLPKQHVSAPIPSAQDATRTATAGEDHTAEPRNAMRRRNSVVSTASNRQRRGRSRSISRVIAGGLTAGPTFSKHD